MMEYKGSAQNGENDKEGFSVRVLGIGGAGANALDRIALEGMEAVSRQVHIGRLRRLVETRQNTFHLVGVIGRHAAPISILVKPLEASVPKAEDH